MGLYLPLEYVCDPLGDQNVWASTKPLNITDKGHKPLESVVIAAAKLDSKSFFFDITPGAESGVSGFVTLLAAAHALRNAQLAELKHNIFYTFFQGETFDYIGSSRMVYDMKNNQFVVDLDNVHSVLEIGQVGLSSDSKLWLHSDPVSRKNSSVNDEVTNLIGKLRVAATNANVSVDEPNFSQPLPPSSFQRFLRDRPIPGVVIEDHQSAFTNRFYGSMYDNAEYLNISYPPNMTPEEQLDHVTDTAKALTKVATMVAQALYLHAGGEEAQMKNISADSQIVTRMLYGFLVRSNNSWFQQIVTSNVVGQLNNRPVNLYVSVNAQTNTLTHLVQCLLANLTGITINTTQENCQNQREDEKDTKNKQNYQYMWVQGAAPPNSTQREGYCVRSTVQFSKAESPAFLLGEYTSKNYSTWTESRWKIIKGRLFLVASHELEMLTLGVGVGVLITSLLLTYIISSKADMLFSSGREPTSATY